MARKTIRNMESIIANGEAPNAPGGFRGQTVNGTVQYEGLGWNRDEDWPNPVAREGGAWQPGRNNRTGE